MTAPEILPQPAGNSPSRLTELDRAAKVEASKTESGLALTFALRHCIDLRYNVDAGLFLRYDGRAWRMDHRQRTMHEIGRHCSLESRDRSESEIRRARKWATAAGVASFVRVDERIAARQADFDADPMLLGAQNGVIDLQTGELLPHDPVHMVSRLCSVDLAPRGARPRRWLRALLQMMAGRRSMVRYLQRLAGYILMGKRPLHLITFVYGGGGNGKSTFVETLAWALGDYAASAEMQTFEEQRGERHPTELARLAGARLVIASENTHASRLNVGLLKRLTGGDRIAARYMRQDYFEFVPRFVPVLVGNHKPRLPAVDDGLARRLHFVPFGVRFDRPNLGLMDELRTEGAAILRWAVEGCLAYQRDGLRPPQEVLAATRAYLEQQDLVGQWIDERTEAVPGHELLAALVANFAKWAQTLGAPHLSARALADDLERRGYRTDRGMRGKRVHGLRLRGAELFDAHDGMLE